MLKQAEEKNNKLSTEINEIKNRNSENQWNQKTALWKDQQIDKTLAKVTKRRRRRNKLLIPEIKRGIITTDPKDIKSIIREYSEQLCPEIKLGKKGNNSISILQK